jgi:L-ribulokinase
MTEHVGDRFTVGIDFGTLSGRAVITRVSDGEIVGEAVHVYEHEVMDRVLSAGDGRQLPPDFALQVPEDYRQVLRTAVPQAVAASGVAPSDIVGIGVDFTSATVIFTDDQGLPLCELDEFRNEPHAYVKLWKHHGAQDQAHRIVALARQRGETWLARYGGDLSSELLLPKALETLEKAPAVYARASQIVDAVDWITWQLTGRLSYAAGDSGYKRMYQDGQYPSPEFLAELNPGFVSVFTEKMSGPVLALGARVGGLSAAAAAWTGLVEGTAVASGNIDAHVAAVSVNAVRPGELTAIMGTSTCWVLPAEEYRDVPGIFGAVDGGIVAGAWGYEGGQSAVGDMFDWFTANCVPAEYVQAAKAAGLHLNDYLMQVTEDLQVGESGVVALDWFNGNRSILIDSDLSGLVVGQTLRTTAPEMFRALVEASAFGARMIIDNFEAHGVPISSVTAAGGLLNSATMMQLYADALKRPLSVAGVAQAGAHGSAIHAAVAAGEYPDIAAAAAAMGRVRRNAYCPDPQRADRYDELYTQYSELYQLFGTATQVMHRLRDIAREAAARRSQ